MCSACNTITAYSRFSVALVRTFDPTSMHPSNIVRTFATKDAKGANSCSDNSFCDF